MAAPSPSTASPLSSTSSASSSSVLPISISPVFDSSLPLLGSSNPFTPLLSNELATALGNPAATSSPTGTGSQSTAETVTGWMISGLLVVIGLIMMMSGTPKTVRLAGAIVAPPAPPVEAAA